jgi:hypothetical protein
MPPARWNRPEKSPPNRRGFRESFKKAAGFGGLFVIGDPNCPIYVAMQYFECCYANEQIAVGIWYA